MGAAAAAKRAGAARRQRELYVRMRRDDDGSYSFISCDELRAAVNTSVMVGVPAVLREKSYRCATQRSGTLDALLSGSAGGETALWTRGTVLRWAARADGYPTREHAIMTAVAMQRACGRWNTALDGRLRLHHVGCGTNAHFVLEFGGDGSGTLVESFTPACATRALNYVRVYAEALVAHAQPLLRCALLHEVGHIVGLQHEHAHSAPYGWMPRARPMETCVVWGTCDPASVMGFRIAADLSTNDVAAVRAAFDHLADGQLVLGTGLFAGVQRVIRRVEPCD